ncbi:hypothetical protein C8R46DRAFT_1258192 [Mycena filopes]|nr:hypothetical protein C8R46DRAFT_1258192 [Mycena filopes]
MKIKQLKNISGGSWMQRRIVLFDNYDVRRLPCGVLSEDKGSTSCIGTPAGYYTNKTGPAQAIACPAGSYQPNKNATSCTATTSGYYTNLPGSSAAIATTPGHYTNPTGATK